MKAVRRRPGDFFGLIIYTMLVQKMKQDSKCPSFQNWNMKVVLITDYYPLTLYFDNGLEFQKGEIDEPDIKLHFSFYTMVQIIKGTRGILSAILSGDIRTEGILQHPIAGYRLYKLMRCIIGE
ncbi:MAG: hypothetical protein R6V83_00885 [Candidatus Thorarchaeota archaeon]